jgi:nicotinamide phosphoribosyltransferase
MMNGTIIGDSYKYSHWPVYPDLEGLYSYYESRGPGTGFNDILWFGLQYQLLKHYSTPLTVGDVEKMHKRMALHFGDDRVFNREGWLHVVEKHGGFPPVRIKAVPEGTVVPTSNVLMTIENTCPECFWMSNFMETLLCMQWAPCTVATNSYNMRKLCYEYLARTGDVSLIDNRVVDFGLRGVSSRESAAILGLAHLVSFKSTDNQAAIDAGEEFYDCAMPGFSIPAAEHSTIITWGKEFELEAYRNVIRVYGKYKMFSCPIDSYDAMRAVREMWGKDLKEEVINMNATAVLRPDSGVPYEIDLECTEALNDSYGSSVNRKGYRVLHPKVRLIQGDRIDYDMIGRIYRVLCDDNKWSADNINFGSGGKLLQAFTRDTQEFAFKPAAAKQHGIWYPVFKDPITDRNKVSKKFGRMSLINHFGQYKTVPDADRPEDKLEYIYDTGKLLKRISLDEVRINASNGSGL